MSQKRVQDPWLSDVFTTTNATQTTSAACSFSTPSNSTIFAHMRATARNTSTNREMVIERYAVYNNFTGTLQVATDGVLNGLMNGQGDAAMAGVSGTLVVSSPTIQPKVTGLAATNVEWLIDVRYWVN